MAGEFPKKHSPRTLQQKQTPQKKYVSNELVSTLSSTSHATANDSLLAKILHFHIIHCKASYFCFYTSTRQHPKIIALHSNSRRKKGSKRSCKNNQHKNYSNREQTSTISGDSRRSSILTILLRRGDYELTVSIGEIVSPSAADL